MFLLKLVIHLLFILPLLASLLFGLNLLVKFLSNQTLALLLTEHGLFLFLVMKKLVEFLDCSPLIFLLDFTVYVGLPINLA